MQLRDYQQDMVQQTAQLWNAGSPNVLGQLSTGAGKCLGKGTPILLFSGEIIPVEDIKPGYLLMGPDSKPREVLSICTGVDDLYEVIPIKGDPYIVNSKHILSLKRTTQCSEPRYPCQKKSGDVVNISVLDYIKSSNSFKHLHKGWRTGVDFPSKTLPETLPPYFLGLWLGDGTSRTLGITTKDYEVVEYLCEFASKLSLQISVDFNKCPSYNIIGVSGKKNPISKSLESYGLKPLKFIPVDYLTGSRSQRLDILAGLLDSDGHYDGKGYDFINKNKEIIEGVAFLSRSLGFSCYIKPCKKSSQQGKEGNYFRCCISGNVENIPCKILRKKANPRKQKKSVSVTGIRVEPRGTGEYFGFQVDGDSLFLLGDFTVTHNSVILSTIVQQHNGYSVVIAHRTELVSQLSLTLAGFGIKHNIIAPKGTIREIVATHHIAYQRGFYDPNAVCFLASVDTLLRLPAMTSWFTRVTLLIIDECFVAGTLIDNRPIETLCVGDYVSAFNEQTKKIEQRRVTHVFKNIKPENMVRVETLKRHVLHCTHGHPFYTKRGWVQAKDLKNDDMVLYTLRQRANNNHRRAKVRISEKGKDILFKKMRIHRQKKRKCCKATSRNTVHNVRGGIRYERASVHAMEKNRACVLQRNMFERVPRENILSNNGENKHDIRFEKNDRTQPYAFGKEPSENVKYAKNKRAQTFNSRRERETTKRLRDVYRFAVSRYGFYLQLTDINPKAETNRRPICLQTGFCEPNDKVSYRNRRGIPQREKKGFRRKERQLLNWVGLDSVTFYKSGSEKGIGKNSPNNFVYNIEVDGLNTYTANGVIVHNCHHVLKGNKWGRACQLFPGARGFFPTATPIRADGRGLGRSSDGLMDCIITGPPMRQLINEGYLCDYRIFAPPNDLDLSQVTRSAGGDFSPAPLRTAVHKSKITGDIVEHYLRIAPGKRGVTFAVDIKAATEIALEFRLQGVKAEVISSLTPPLLRQQLMRRFREGDLLQLVNVDILGEGVDVPAIEVVSMGRPTESYATFAQHFGRALRPLIGKQHAIIIDHVNNYARHGLPDAPRTWTLQPRERRARNTPEDVIPLKTCIKCLSVYTRFIKECPYCGHYSQPQQRNAPQFVDGDLFELDADTLAALRGEAERNITDPPKYPRGVEPYVIKGIQNRHAEKIRIQGELRESIAQWAGYHKHNGASDSEIYRRFYHAFNIDILSAQALGVADSTVLYSKVVDNMGNNK